MFSVGHAGSPPITTEEAAPGPAEAASARTPLTVEWREHHGDIDAGTQPVLVADGKVSGTITTTEGSVRVTGSKSAVTPTGYLAAGIRMDSGPINVGVGAEIGGDILTRTGKISLYATKVRGDVVQEPLMAATVADRIACELDHPTLTADRTTITGRLQGERVVMRDASADLVLLDGRRLAALGAAARLDIHGTFSARAIESVGPALVVWHDQSSRRVKVGPQVSEMVLYQVGSLSKVEESLKALAQPPEPFSAAAWSQLQIGLEFLLSRHVIGCRSRFPVNDRRPFMDLFIERGRQAADTLLRWLEKSPKQVLGALGQLDREGMERTCALLAIAMMRGTLDPQDPADRRALDAFARMAGTRGAGWADIQSSLDYLEGRSSLNGAVWQPEPLVDRAELAALRDETRQQRRVRPGFVPMRDTALGAARASGRQPAAMAHFLQQLRANCADAT